MPNLRHLAVHTDRDTITRIQAMPAILLHADASGVAAVMPWLADCKALYVLADMGDWPSGGSIATPALVRLAREAGLHTVALVGMPCVWEGERRNTAALHALESLRDCATETVVVHGDAVAERLGEDATFDQLVEAFDAELLQELDARLAF
jgi:cell division GTPase FtsZ